MSTHTPKQTPSDYLTVQEAATFLDVPPSALWNRDRKGNLKAKWNPANGYRLYLREDLTSLLKQIEGA